MYETIKVDVSNQIMTIVLNRPERLNAFTTQMLEELLQALDQADLDDHVRVVILTGAGRAFCAGADLQKGGDSFAKEGKMEDYRDFAGILTLRMYDLKKPLIAAINGPAVGVGITMTMPADYRIASQGAKMGFVFTRRGIAPEGCSGWFLPRIVGINRALDWVISGRIFYAEEALESGLVSQVVPPDELLATAKKIASEIAENTSATSVALTKQLMWRMLEADHPIESHRIESKMIHWTGRQPDSREGVESFFEKRKPVFKMKVSSDMPDFYPWWKERNL
jgi:enoyl-CoA hydratase/carnithine racemase